MTTNLRLFIAAALIVLAGCNEKQKSQENPPTEKTVEQPKTEQKPDGSKKTATAFGGTWINKKYVDRLMDTKSPKKSQDVVSMAMLALPNHFNEQATIILNFHEGVTGKVVQKDNAFEIKSPETEGLSTTFQVENGRIKTETDVFIKLNTNFSNIEFKVAEQLLFAGTYEIDGKKVEFTSSGKVTGLDTFSYYSVLIDYYDAGMQVDQMRLGTNQDNSNLYGFDFKKNTLSIYELKCVSPTCDVVKNGKRLYKLKKIS